MPKVPRDPENVRVGRILRDLRESRGLKVPQLAPQLGLSRSHLYAIEYGDRRLTNVIAYRAARVLDIPVTVFRTDLNRSETAGEDEEPELAAAS